MYILSLIESFACPVDDWSCILLSMIYCRTGQYRMEEHSSANLCIIRLGVSKTGQWLLEGFGSATLYRTLHCRTGPSRKGL
jgi:hypothetical protein